MKDLHLIVVGKLQDDHLKSLEDDYLKRLTTFKIQIHEVKAHAEDLNKEAKEVLQKIQTIDPLSFICLLMEKGKQFDSVGFSKWLVEKRQTQKIIFIIGGASGHGESVIEKAHFKLSLSELTYPHKIARLLLIEQIYRAQTIKDNHPYNK